MGAGACPRDPNSSSCGTSFVEKWQIVCTLHSLLVFQPSYYRITVVISVHFYSSSSSDNYMCSWPVDL